MTDDLIQEYGSRRFMRNPPMAQKRPRPVPDEEIDSSSDESRARHRAFIRSRLQADEDIDSSD